MVVIFLLPKRHPLHSVVLGYLPVGIMSFLRFPSCPHLIILRTHYYWFWGDGHWSRLSWTACTISDLVPIPSHLFPTFISTTFSHLESQPNVSSIVASFSTFYDLSTPFPIHTRPPCVFSFPHHLPSAIRWSEAVPGDSHITSHVFLLLSAAGQCMGPSSVLASSHCSCSVYPCTILSSIAIKCTTLLCVPPTFLYIAGP